MEKTDTFISVLWKAGRYMEGVNLYMRSVWEVLLYIYIHLSKVIFNIKH